MKQRALAVALTAALAAGSTAPALANGAASTRNIIVVGAAAALLVSNYLRKARLKREERKEATRRQEAYRDWFYHKYGYYPTYDQFKRWYVQTYNANPG